MLPLSNRKAFYYQRRPYELIIKMFSFETSLHCVNYNPGHNILELYIILVQIRFTTSKKKLDNYYSKLGMRVASRITERLKT